MKPLIAIVVLFASVVCWAGPARSDMSVSSYQANMANSTKRNMTMFYLEAVGTGITWTNSVLLSKTKVALFCPPSRLKLKGEVAARLLNRHLATVQGKQLRSNDSVSFALLATLMYAYPCK